MANHIVDESMSDYELFVGHVFGDNKPTIAGLGDDWSDVFSFVSIKQQLVPDQRLTFSVFLYLKRLSTQAGMLGVLGYLARNRHLCVPGRWVSGFDIFRLSQTHQK